MALIDKLKEEQKLAMKAKDKLRLGTIRLALSAIKQREVDEQITLGEDDILAVLTKMVKQRRDSVTLNLKQQVVKTLLMLSKLKLLYLRTLCLNH